MLNMILAALKAAGIAEYIITEEKKETAELYFVRKKLDMPRLRSVSGFRVRVFRDYISDGERMKGESEIRLFPGQTAIEVEAELIKAYNAAGFVKNKYYELYAPGPDQAGDNAVIDEDGTADAQEMCLAAAEELYGADTDNVSFVNSAEIFGSVSRIHILTSAGTDVAYVQRRVRGEYVVQCKKPRDVEQYFDFKYKPENLHELGGAVREALKTVRDRAGAIDPPQAGVYDIILSGKHLKTVLDYYLERSCTSMVFPGYSDWAKGTNVQGDKITGEKLSVTAVPDAPYSSEGIFMPSRKLISDGKLELLHGNTRHSRYIGAEPTGLYFNLKVDCGTVAFDKLKEGCLYPVSFSDFQLDSFSGFFGGEIRLAYLFTDSGVKVLTGGSINGNISEAQGDMTFSLERYADSSYEGPLAVKLKGVRVAGC